MHKIILLGADASPFTRKVRIVLLEKNIPFEQIKAPTAGEDNPVIPFNPLGKVPTIVIDDNKSLYDSRVITEYLDTLVPAPPLLPPPGMDRVEVKRWESLGDGICDAGVALMGERRRLAAAERSQAFIDRQRNKFERGIATAARELGNRACCHGNAITLADVALVTALDYIEFRFPEMGWPRQYPELAAYQARLSKRPAFASTRPSD